VSVFLDELVEQLRQQPHRPSWLVCPSPQTGEAWRTRLLRMAPDVNPPKMTTLWRLAREWAEPELQREGLTPASPAELEAVVWHLWKTTAGTAEEVSSPVLQVQTLCKTIQELRLASVESEHLEWAAFDTKRKAQRIQQILAAYEQLLRQQRLADPAKVFLFARDRLIGEGRLSDMFLYLPDDLSFTGLMQSILDQLPELDCRRLATTSVDSPLATESLPLFSSHQSGAGQSQRRSLSIRRALDPRFEVQLVLGTLLRGKIPFDQAEVLYSDANLYPDLFLETLQARAEALSNQTSHPSQESHPRPPQLCTFGDGIPVRWTRPGRALHFWLDWVRHEVRPDELLELLSQNLLTLPVGLDATESLCQLQRFPVCRSIPHWRQRLQARLQRSQSEPTEHQTWRQINQMMEGLFAQMPATQLTAQDAWNAAAAILQHVVAVKSAWDEATQARGLALVQALRGDLSQSAEAVWDRLRSWIEQDRLPGEAPRPGCLHLNSLLQGGQTGRPNSFILGLAEDAFPSLPRQDSLLSDRERGKISPELAQRLRREAQQAQETQLQWLLGTLSGEIVLTYPCANQVEDCEQFPCQQLLQVFRQLSKKPQGTLRDFEAWLPPPLGPASPELRLSLADEFPNPWPSQGLLDQRLAREYPHLTRGAQAARARRQLSLTEFDGWVPQSGVDLDWRHAQPVYSADALETLTACPLQFFWAKVVHLTRPPELVGLGPQWLSPLIRGEILHQVFFEYHATVKREQRQPRKQDAQFLADLLHHHLQSRGGELPPAPPQQQELELEELERTLHLFLDEEIRQSPCSAPAYLEASFGLPRDHHQGSPLDTEAAVSFRLPSGRTVGLCGRVDRIDRLTEKGDGSGPRFFVWDYKTGGTFRYQGENLLQSGQLLQPLLYQIMVQQRLREVVDANANVEGVGFFFPGQRGQGDRISWQAEEVRESAEVLDRMADVIGQGAFLALGEESVCVNCSFRLACDLRHDPHHAARKLQHAANTALQPLRLLRPSKGKNRATS
jgi:hypothetical protein